MTPVAAEWMSCSVAEAGGAAPGRLVQEARPCSPARRAARGRTPGGDGDTSSAAGDRSSHPFWSRRESLSVVSLPVGQQKAEGLWNIRR